MPRLQYVPMAIILDANALINLHKAGLLATVSDGIKCIIPREVYAEVVDAGRQAGYRDADEISEIIGPKPDYYTDPLPEMSRFGPGEVAVLSRYLRRQGEPGSDSDVIVSDDSQFLNYLRRKTELEGVRIPYLTTAAFIAKLGSEGKLNSSSALAALDSIRSRTRESDYQAARQLLETV